MIQFMGADRHRRSIRLGKVPLKYAGSVRTHIEHILTAQLTKQPIYQNTAIWIASLESSLAEKLAKAGLIPRLEAATPSVAARESIRRS